MKQSTLVTPTMAALLLLNLLLLQTTPLSLGFKICIYIAGRAARFLCMHANALCGNGDTRQVD
jgi:hypothetical protein